MNMSCLLKVDISVESRLRIKCRSESIVKGQSKRLG
jgi:hypothetical protein